MALAGVIVGALSVGAPVEAAWPASGVRAISGKACRLINNGLSFGYCLYVADDTFAAADNTTSFADWHVNGSSTSVTGVSSCFVRYTGNTAMCGTGSFVSGSGVKHAQFNGFAPLFSTFSASAWDYFFVNVSWDFSTPSATIDAIYGVDYTG